MKPRFITVLLSSNLQKQLPPYTPKSRYVLCLAQHPTPKWAPNTNSLYTEDSTKQQGLITKTVWHNTRLPSGHQTMDKLFSRTTRLHDPKIIHNSYLQQEQHENTNSLRIHLIVNRPNWGSSTSLWPRWQLLFFQCIPFILIFTLDWQVLIWIISRTNYWSEMQNMTWHAIDRYIIIFRNYICYMAFCHSVVQRAFGGFFHTSSPSSTLVCSAE